MPAGVPVKGAGHGMASGDGREEGDAVVIVDGGRAARQPAGGGGSTGIDLCSMSHEQLMAMALRHNISVGVPPDPVGGALHGTESHACVRGRPVHPFSLGGNPDPDDPDSAAWASIARSASRPLPAPAGLAGLALTGSGAAAGYDTTKGCASGPEVGLPFTPLQKYGHVLGAEHQRLQPFVAHLGHWLGRPVDLPLLAAGTPPLCLKHLFMQVRWWRWWRWPAGRA